MDKWIEIEEFDFEGKNEEYSFTTRLAFENSWTINFTQLAIIEYKKFMYLASISDDSVSPSFIVDIVWHQHLIFSESYNSFCKLLGKRINHIPSTHKKEQKNTFNLAKKHTTRLYQDTFGDQPKIIWDTEDVLKTIPLIKFIFLNYESKILVRIIICVTVSASIFFWSNQFIRQIQNPHFLFLFAVIFITALLINIVLAYVFGFLIIKKINQSWIIKNLHPYELIYTKYDNIGYLILKIVDDLIKKRQISIDERKVIILDNKNGDNNKYEGLVLHKLEEHGNMRISSLVQLIKSKPLIDQTKKSITALKDYIFDSSSFNFYYLIVTSLYSSILGFGVCRLYNGLMNDKPIVFLVISLILTGVIVYKLNKRVFVNFIFRYPICSSKKDELNKNVDGNIDFFLLSSAALLISDLNKETIFRSPLYGNGDSSGSCSSGDSGCGSGCGGCGGD